MRDPKQKKNLGKDEALVRKTWNFRVAMLVQTIAMLKRLAMRFQARSRPIVPLTDGDRLTKRNPRGNILLEDPMHSSISTQVE